MKTLLAVLCAMPLLLAQTFTHDPAIQAAFEKRSLTGVFLLYDEAKDIWLTNNDSLAQTGFIPASTFKIPNSIIGLETGVIADENFVLPWDSVARFYDAWNKDQDLAHAIKHSTVWYYQELARRVGEEKMNAWIQKLQYGNMDISGGVDQFWLRGAIRISPFQQIKFLRAFASNNLLVSERSSAIVKKITIQKEGKSGIVRAKTGWGFMEEVNIGWFVGYVEKTAGNFYFATLLIVPGDLKTFPQRQEITYELLNHFSIFPIGE